MGLQYIVEQAGAVDALAINKDHHIGPQMTLIVQNIATQTRVADKGIVQCGAQISSAGFDFRHLGEAAQLRGKNQAWHGFKDQHEAKWVKQIIDIKSGPERIML